MNKGQLPNQEKWVNWSLAVRNNGQALQRKSIEWNNLDIVKDCKKQSLKESGRYTLYRTKTAVKIMETRQRFSRN